MSTRQLSADDWELYRDVRLESLETDPGAFGATLSVSQMFDENDWRKRLTTGPDGRPAGFFIDLDVRTEPAIVVGTAGVIYTADHAAPMLVSMWVRPSSRGSGAGRRLVDSAFEWAAARNETHMVLWVVQDNSSARRLYESCGFTPTGNVDVLPSNPDSHELEMIAELS